jgi:thiamine transporter
MRNPRIIVLAEVALAVALAAVLNYVGLRIMPQGGSVSLAMLPIFVVALRRGVGPGVIAGALYGFLDFMMAPFFVHYAQLALDYVVAFGALGLAGLFSPAWNRAVAEGRTARGVWTAAIPGIALGAIARWAAHVVSGVLFFAEYAPEGQPVLLYSIGYNVTYMLPSAVVCGAAAALVLPALRNVGAPARPSHPAEA